MLKNGDNISKLNTGVHHPRRFTTFLIHLIVIGMVFIIPEVINTIGHQVAVPWQITVGIYTKSLIYITVFYLNYFFILPAALKRPHPWLSLVLWNVVAFVVALFTIWSIYCWLAPYWTEMRIQSGRVTSETNLHRAHLLFRTRLMTRDSIMLLLSAALSVALKLSVHWRNMEENARRMTAEQREQELNSLKNQLNPHFLFNTLNTIYALIATSPTSAQKAVHELSDMLRYVLYENGSTVTLAQECKFLSSYVDLMKLRWGNSERIDFTCKCNHDMCNLQVAPLLFIPLIENAFKHGNTGKAEDIIHINLSAENGRITCRTLNTIAPVNTFDNKIPLTGHKISHRAGGIGLQNLKRRLVLLYGKNMEFYTDNNGTEFATYLSIDLSQNTNPTNPK